jgi:uncharacterized protein (DUF1330 family)
MSVLFIAKIAEIMDPGGYAEYVRQVLALVARYGGIYVVRGGNPRPLIAGWKPARMIVIEFADETAARACFESEEYRRLAPLREGSTVSRALLVDSVGRVGRVAGD